jgi:hypothetical protein
MNSIAKLPSACWPRPRRLATDKSAIARRFAAVLPNAPMNFGRFYRFWFYAHPKPLAEGLGTA